MKKVVILQSNYIPWQGYFYLMSLSDVFVIYDSVQFTSRDWRNRNYLITSQSKIRLTIPVMKDSSRKAINEVIVADQEWNVKHWKVISDLYKRYKGFREYGEQLEKLFLDMDSIYLSEINSKIIHFFKNLLELKTQVISDRSFEMIGDKNEKIIKMCSDLDSQLYISGGNAKSYLDEARFNEMGIGVEWCLYEKNLTYKQGTMKFDPNVSILDLILRLGSEGVMQLKDSWIN